MLIVFRGLQGLGAALIAPAALSIITATFAEGAERTKAMGVWAAIAVGGGAVGLVLGGILVEALSWPWIFFVNVPVGIAVFVAALRYVPESRDEHAHKSFDLAGAVTVTAGLIALVYGIVKAQEKGWASLHTVGFFALAIVLLGSFVVIERRSAEPLVRLSIFRVRTVPRGERRDVPRRLGALRDVLLQHALPPARARLLGARGRASHSSRSRPGSSSAPACRSASSRSSARARCR